MDLDSGHQGATLSALIVFSLRQTLFEVVTPSADRAALLETSRATRWGQNSKLRQNLGPTLIYIFTEQTRPPDRTVNL